jgi:LuxR family maltose regulon positive regulatory protein
MLDESGARIILLVAPAGYGKTTLAHEWLEGKRAAWYRASPASADVAALAVGLARAAAEIMPGAGARMTQRLRATDRPEEDARILAEMLAEDLAEWPNAWLAIDDYQFAMDSPASEEFLGLLSELLQIRMLLTSRRRPAWATARRRVYGELEEVDRTMLAMTDEEALLLLGSEGAATPEFLTSMQGWPALIGLAAVATSRPLARYPVTSSPDDYLTEELYDAASPELRSRLCDVALAPTDRLVEYLFSGASARNLLDEGLRLGFLTQHASSFELHPVVREFLVNRARERTDHGERVRSIGGALLQTHAWDEAFAVAQQHDSKELILQVVENATEPLLAQGRVSTLEHWLNYAGDNRIADEVLDYAEAEVAFRNASHTKAEVLGARAAAGLGPNHRLASRAYTRAGHSAYLRGDLDRASSLLSKALESALTSRDVREASWGQFLCAVETERPDSSALLEQFAETVDRHPGDLMRIKTGEIFLALRGLREVSTDLLSTIHLADHVNDCMSESSFLNGWMGLAIYFGRYREVLEVSCRQRALIENFRLDFVLPHLYLREATAYRGQRRFRECRRALDKAEASGIEPRDGDVTASVRMARALAELQQGRPAVALELLEHPPTGHHSASWTGEYLATRALVLAVAGQEDAALEEADSADCATLAIEARGLSSFARAVADCQRGSSSETHSVRRAYERAETTNNVDSLVSAYRSYPPLLGKIWRYCDQKMFLLEAVDRADDGSLARSAKLPTVFKRSGTGSLSPREQEILDLVRQGLTNAEIAQTLFVSVSTVKAHMRHIFEKLGVRTRTEAALLTDS